MSDNEAVQRLFARVLDASPDDRARLLAAEPADDVRREVAELVRCAERDHPFDRFRIEPSSFERGFSESLGPWPDPAPDAIGAYRVLGLLGTGSMSTVFRAERSHPRAEVAVKVLKPWLTGGSGLRRFEAEVEMLARLDHPAIARILDAGRAELGGGDHPYFVLELVDGRPLDAWVAAEHPSRAERLRVFLALCDGVAHAHQRGVIHRDLKPSNVLVDARGAPRILDFGIARAAGDDAAAASLLTSLGQIVGTLEYMSPEQASGRPDLIDTRADVYALGVLLYELLAERRPISFSGEALPECLRRIAEEEPVPLGRLDAALAGDLETIVAKALEKDRGRRYATVRELASDVERYRADLPIAARPPSSLYLARKYVRRHPALAATLAVGTAAAFVTVVGVVLGWREAREQARLATERLAEADAARDESDRVAAVLAGMIRAPSADRLGRDVLLRDVVMDLGPELRLHLPEQPRGRGRLGVFLARSLASLGEPERALEHVETALADLDLAGLGVGPLALDAGTLRADLLGRLGRADEAEAALSALVATYTGAVGADDPRVLELRMQRGSALLNLGRDAEGEREIAEARAALVRALGPDAPELLAARVALAGAWLNLGLFERVLAELEPALPALRTAFAGDPEVLRGALSNVAEALTATGELERALAMRREQVALCKAAFGPEHYYTWDARADLMGTLPKLGMFAEAAELAEATLAWAEGRLAESHPMILRALETRATKLVMEDRFPEALEAFREALRRGALRLPADDPGLIGLRVRMAMCAQFLGDTAQVHAILDPLLDELDPEIPAHLPALAAARLELAKAQLFGGEVAEGTASLEEAIALNERMHGAGSPYTAYTILDGAEALLRVGRGADAEELLTALRDRFAASPPASGFELEIRLSAELFLGTVYAVAGDLAAGRSQLALAEGLLAEHGEPLGLGMTETLAPLFADLREALARDE